MEPTATKSNNTSKLNNYYQKLFTYLRDNTNSSIDVWTPDNSAASYILASEILEITDEYIITSDRRKSSSCKLIPYCNITKIKFSKTAYENINTM